MPPLRDPEIIAKFALAFEDRTSGGVQWKRVPAEWVRKNFDGWSTKAVDDLLHEHLACGGQVDQVEEAREEYRQLHQYHYDFRIPILGRQIYVETVLTEANMGPIVTVVSIHVA